MNASAATVLPRGLRDHWEAFAGTYGDPVTGERVPHGFPIETGGYNETFYCFFDHDVQNPWRPGPRGPLDEDLSAPFLLVPGMPPLGDVGYHGLSACYEDNSLPARQRMFLQIFLERLYREYTGAEDKIWTFGWHEHLFDLYPEGFVSPIEEPAHGHPIHAFREAVRGMVDWLNERFIGRGIAQYASVEEVAGAFYEWEAAHPGESSFDYPVRERDWDVYPYKLKGLTQELMYAHYVREITAFRDQGVHVHELLKTDGRNWRYRNGQITSDGPTRPIYLLWSEAGEQMVDFSGIVEGELRCVDGESGVEDLWPVEALRVAEVPIVCMESGGER